MVEDIRLAVHRLTNHLQVVLSYLELEQYKKALVEVKRAIAELHVLAKTVSGLIVTRQMPEDSVVVVPHGTRTVSSDDIISDVPSDSVTIVPESDVKEGRGKDNEKSK